MFEHRPIDVAAEVTVESGQDRVLGCSAAVGIDVAEAPGKAAAVAIVGEGVGHERSGGNRGKLQERHDLEIHAVGGVLYRVLLRTVEADDGGDALLPRPEAGFMARVEDGIQRRFLERAERMIGNGYALGADEGRGAKCCFRTRSLRASNT